MIPSQRQILRALRRKPQTTRELIERFGDDKDDPDELRRKVELECVRLSRHGHAQRVPEPSGRNALWMAVNDAEVDGEPDGEAIDELIDAVRDIDLSSEAAIPDDVPDDEDVEMLVRAGDLRRLRQAGLEMGLW